MKEEIKKILKNKMSREILIFFYQNQSSIDTVGGVSAWVQSDRKKVKEILDRLVELGVLEEDSTSSTKAYCYTRNAKIMKVVQGLMKENA
ncbi:MAG: hypothetical protein ACE5JK_01465 [Candidatus Omnitrophota bacterium]